MPRCVAGSGATAPGSATMAAGRALRTPGNCTRATGSATMAASSSTKAAGNATIAAGSDTKAAPFIISPGGSGPNAAGNTSIASGSATMAPRQHPSAQGSDRCPAELDPSASAFDALPAAIVMFGAALDALPVALLVLPDAFDLLPAAFVPLPAAIDALPAAFTRFHASLHSLPGQVSLRPPAVPLDDATLLQGFVAGDAGRTRELLERLLPLLNEALQRRWPSLKSAYPDIIGQCGVALVHWRHDLRAGRGKQLRIDDPLPVLAERLVHQEARQIRRGWARDAVVADNLTLLDVPAMPPSPEAVALDAEEEQRLDDLIAQLPFAHEQAIRAQLQAEMPDGPPLHETLGCRPGAARVRLTRARQALARLLDTRRDE